MKKGGRKYDAEFKRQAVRMVIEDHRSCHSVEKALGMPAGLLYRWVRAVKADPHECFPGNGRVKPSVGDVNNLLKQIEHLTRERDILKKALGIFSRIPAQRTASSLVTQRS
jgi:transposase